MLYLTEVFYAEGSMHEQDYIGRGDDTNRAETFLRGLTVMQIHKKFSAY
jgi:hypothetical protein